MIMTMIKFFDRTRIQQLSAGNVGRYTKYAIGEIILVVIGILLALQINTWSQNIKDAKEEFQILQKLRMNIATDTTNLKTIIARIESYIEAIVVIENEMKNESLEHFSVDLSRPLLGAVSINLETTTWENLKSTGKLNLIKNALLLDSLQSYYKQFQNVNKTWTEGFQSYNRRILAPKFFEFDDFTFFPPGTGLQGEDVQRLPPAKYAENVFFRNVVRYRKGALMSIKNIFAADLDRAISMLNMLSKEIENE